MDSLERRTFLKIAAGAAATTANFLYPGITKAADARTEVAIVRVPKAALDAVSGPDPNMAFGTVVSKATNGVVLQYGTSKTYAVRISPDITVWKEFDVTPDVIQLGDWLDVKGTLLQIPENSTRRLEAGKQPPEHLRGWTGACVMVNERQRPARRAGHVAVDSPPIRGL